MNNKHISVDIEASGPTTPIRYNMLSFGACVVGDIGQQFYRELKPIHPINPEHYHYEATRIGSMGLKYLEDITDPRYDPNNPRFQPDLVLKVLEEKGEEPKKAMLDFSDWIDSVSKGTQSILLTDIQPFDGIFIMSYFDMFDIDNPFGYKGRNIDELYRGVRRDFEANLRDLGLEIDESQNHNALYDAIFQARLAEEVFKLIGEK